MHFCGDELAVLMLMLSALPFVGIYFKRFAVWLKARNKPHCCDHSHTDQEAA